MTGGIETAGDLVTGAAIARVVEPDTGEDAERGGAKCLNCGTQTMGSYCHECGQSIRIHRTLSAFWHDFTHSILHFEGKIWRTIPLLFFRPGQLTRRYVHGERARFVSPLALFLFSVFLMFATFGWVGMPVGSGAEGTQIDRAALSDELARTRARLSSLERAKAAQAEIARVRKDAQRLEAAVSLADGRTIDESTLARSDINIGIPSLDTALKDAIRNPALLLYKMQSNAYKFSWALIPISIPFVWLLFIFRRQFKVYDHAIFVTYSLSFMSLFLVFLSVLGQLGPLADWRAPLIVSAPPAHMFFQLSGAYEIGLFAALWRTIALLFIAFFVLIQFGILLLALGVSG